MIGASVMKELMSLFGKNGRCCGFMVICDALLLTERFRLLTIFRIYSTVGLTLVN